MRTAYRILAYLLALSVAVQAALIAFGAFALEDSIDNGPISDGDTTGVTLHHSFAYAAYSAAIIGVLHGLNALAIFAVALLAGRRVPKTAPLPEPSATENAPV